MRHGYGWWTSAWLVACGGDVGSPSAPLDLVAEVPTGEARAGWVNDEAALFGGLSAEGQVGDILVKNARVQFVIQGPRAGDYYVQEGGGVVDADIVRPAGEPGRDLVDEWGTLLGIGRTVSPDAIEVLNDGRKGGPAVVRVRGRDSALALIEGALEAPGFLPSLGLEVETTYTLEPEALWMRVQTRLTATTGPATLAVGDLLMSGPEHADTFAEGTGLGDLDDRARRWAGYTGHDNGVAVGLLAAPGTVHSPSGGELLSELAFVVVGFGPEFELAPGETVSWERLYGVGPDWGTLSDAALAYRGEATEALSGTVTAPDGSVAGARVGVSVEGEPFTLAVSNADGNWSAEVPAGVDATALAIGRGHGRVLDLPVGAMPTGPYTAAAPAEVSFTALSEGASGRVRVEGRGVADPAMPMQLGQAGTLSVQDADGLPLTIRVDFEGDDPVGDVDERWVPGRPNGLSVAGWTGDGSMVLPVEPGTYRILAHRGMRYEVHESVVTIEPGQTTDLAVDLGPPVDHGGWLLGDPHAHASPSGDGEITMEGRLLVAAASGTQIHFGTDHDHFADYQPVLDALGLGPVLATVLADEVSPPLRGHLNIYPVTRIPDAPNRGAYSWWSESVQSTQELVDTLRARHGEDFILQMNHPLDSGVAEFAGWELGSVDDPSRWTADSQAMEVNNAGNIEYVEPYLDLVVRGHAIAAIGVTDSHHHFGGGPGINGTWIDLGDDPNGFSDAELSAAFRDRATVATRGPFMDLSVRPGSTVTQTTDLRVEARGPSWITVDRLVLLKNGEVAATVEGAIADFVLDSTEDAIFHVRAEGDTRMQPVSNDTPWALSSGIRFDAGGDGWVAPVGPLDGL